VLALVTSKILSYHNEAVFGCDCSRWRRRKSNEKSRFLRTSETAQMLSICLQSSKIQWYIDLHVVVLCWIFTLFLAVHLAWTPNMFAFGC